MRSIIRPDGQNTLSFIEAARRAQIIKHAIETIAELGYEQASLAQIAHRAGISKGVITYYFAGKDELLEQVVSEIYTAAVKSVSQQIASQPTAKLRLQAYIRSSVEYIGTHRAQMIALVELLTHYRGGNAKPLFRQVSQEAILADLEALLRTGQKTGDFRPFDTRVMAVTIRRAIDAVPPLYATDPELDVNAYAAELARLFDQATCKG